MNDHACPLCGDSYPSDYDIELCELGHAFSTSGLLEEHFRAMAKEVFICCYLLRHNAVPWTRRQVSWSDKPAYWATMPADCEKWRLN